MQRMIHLTILVLLVGGCGDRDVTSDADGVTISDGSPPDCDGPTCCPPDPQQGASCNLDPAIECAGIDHLAFSCGLQTCRCQGGIFDCTPFSPGGGEGCDPFEEGASCMFEGNTGCDVDPPVSGAVRCKDGKWVYWTSCHPECPYAYSESLPGTPCSFTPDEGDCSWTIPFALPAYCTCRDGKFDCS